MASSYAVDGREDLPRVQRRRGYLREDATTAPTFSSAVVENAAASDLVITCSENIAADDARGFEVFVNSVSRGITAIAIATNTITLTLASAVTAGQTVTYDYDTDAGTGSVASVDDSALMSSSTANAVTNNVL